MHLKRILLVEILTAPVSSYYFDLRNLTKYFILPSLKEPRDLTLGGIVKRKFVPTIPAVKSKKGSVETLDKDIVKAEIKFENKHTGKDKFNKRDFKGKQKNELIQLKSIFDEGPKEEFKSKRESNKRAYSDRESTSSAIKFESSKSQQNGENKELLDRLLKDDFIVDDDDSSINSDEDSKSFHCKETKPIILPFKKELPQKLEEPEISFEDLFKDELILIQLPDTFPGYPPTDPTILANKNSDIKEERPNLGAFSDGSSVGKLRLHRSGKLTLLINDVIFNVERGLPSNILQEVVLMDIKDGEESGEMTVVGNATQKLTLVPDIDSMLDSINTNQ